MNALVVLVLIVLIALITFVGRCQVRSAMDPARKCTCNVHTGECCSRRDMLNVPCPHLGAACLEAGVDVSKFVSPQETTAKWKELYATAPKFEIPTGGTEGVPWLTNPSAGTEMKLTASDDFTVMVVCPPVMPNPAGRMSVKRKAAYTNIKKDSKRRLATPVATTKAKRQPYCRKCKVYGHPSKKCSGLTQVQGGFNFAQAAAEKTEKDRLKRQEKRKAARFVEDVLLNTRGLSGANVITSKRARVKHNRHE